MANVATRKQNIPVAQMKSFTDVLKSSMTENMMRRINPNYDTRMALGALFMVSDAAKKGTRSIADCSPQSIVGALMSAAHSDLYPVVPGSGSNCGLYFIPFYNKDAKEYRVSLIPSYQALVYQAMRSGQVVSMRSGVHYDDDYEFTYVEGLDPELRHVPGNREGDILGAWAMAELETGGKVMAYQTRAEIEKRVKTDGSFYRKWPAEMARKTVIRHLCGLLPPTPVMMNTLAQDDAPRDFTTLAETEDMSMEGAGRIADVQDIEDIVESEVEEAEVQEEKPKPKAKAKAKPKPKPEPEPEVEEAEVEDEEDEEAEVEEEDATEGLTMDGLSDDGKAILVRLNRYIFEKNVPADKAMGLLRNPLSELADMEEAAIRKLVEDYNG